VFESDGHQPEKTVMSFLLRSSILSLCLLLLASASPAADLSRESHLVMGGNLGVGSAWLGDEVPDEGGRETGLAANFRVGYGLSPTWFLGVETSSWSDFHAAAQGDADVTFRTFGPSLAFFPGGGGFYLRGILGWSWLDLTLETSEQVKAKTQESGFGFAAAVGYEWRLSTLIAVGPQLDLGYLDVGEVEAFTQVLGRSFSFSAWWLNATVSLTLYM